MEIQQNAHERFDHRELPSRDNKHNPAALSLLRFLENSLRTPTHHGIDGAGSASDGHHGMTHVHPSAFPQRVFALVLALSLLHPELHSPQAAHGQQTGHLLWPRIERIAGTAIMWTNDENKNGNIIYQRSHNTKYLREQVTRRGKHSENE